MNIKYNEYEIVINPDGELLFKRPGRLLPGTLFCPYVSDFNNRFKCNDQCALFGEPKEFTYNGDTRIKIEICKNTFICNIFLFLDERR